MWRGEGVERIGQASAVAVVGISAGDLRTVAIFVICLLISVCIHEFAHAYSADKLGDPTPAREGRLTLNPASHADPIGTLALPIMAGLFKLPVLFGWGRPVPTQPRYYTRKISMRAGLALVAFAGPFSNLLQALVTAGVWVGLARAGVVAPGDGFWDILSLFYRLNVVLMLFNLLPLHPLDGGKILAWALPPSMQHVDDFLMKHGGTILMALIFLPAFVNLPDVIGLVFGPPMRWSTEVIHTLMSL